jgi:HPt (histidine-containing phosphotransfer) domain-containing protein
MLVPLDAHDGLVFDSRNLLRMQGYLNPASFWEIVEDFRSAIEQRLCDLDKPNLSAGRVGHICHDLLTLAGTLGLFELQAAAERLSNFKGNDRLPIEYTTADVRNAGARALSALSEYINARNA